jgi:hypothetical protein
VEFEPIMKIESMFDVDVVDPQEVEFESLGRLIEEETED